MNVRFERRQYLQQLIDAEDNGMIKIITGIRRCGKSFLLFNLYKQSLLNRGIPADHIIEVNLEDRRCKRLRDPDNLLTYIDARIKDARRYFVLLDEIQQVRAFEDVLNSYLHMEHVNVYVTGSFSPRDRGLFWAPPRCFHSENELSAPAYDLTINVPLLLSKRNKAACSPLLEQK